MGVLHCWPVHFPCDGHPNPLQFPVTTNNASVFKHVPLETKEKVGMGHILRDCTAGPQAMGTHTVTKHCQIAPECPNHTTLPLAEGYADSYLLQPTLGIIQLSVCQSHRCELTSHCFHSHFCDYWAGASLPMFGGLLGFLFQTLANHLLCVLCLSRSPTFSG